MISKEPALPLGASYRPSGSVTYKVQDGDSWWSLATSSGVDPWWLIQYNFETRNPAEVNWYLKNWVGCIKTSPSGKNLMFSSAAKPGQIYLPAPQKVRGMRNLAYGIYGIGIEGNDEYKDQVRLTLDYISRSETGMVLLNAIKGTGKSIVISPWNGTDCNATAGAENIVDATRAGYVVLKGGSSFEQMLEPSLLRDLLGLPKDPLMGTGKGSDSHVRFSPRMFGYGASGACGAYAGKPGASPSQVLFHELSHAYRQARGVFNTRPTIGGSKSYDNMEEFFAVVLSNVLISDPTYSSGNRTLRADHSGFVPLAPNLSTSTGFITSLPNRNKIREIVEADPGLAKSLRGVDSFFNPFVENL